MRPNGKQPYFSRLRRDELRFRKSEKKNDTKSVTLKYSLNTHIVYWLTREHSQKHTNWTQKQTNKQKNPQKKTKQKKPITKIIQQLIPTHTKIE